MIFHHIFDFVFLKIIFSIQLFLRLALDFRTFLENMKMSSLLSKILETGINVFKIKIQIIKNKNYNEISTIYNANASKIIDDYRL